MVQHGTSTFAGLAEVRAVLPSVPLVFWTCQNSPSGHCIRLDGKDLTKGTLKENIASVEAAPHFRQVNASAVSIISPVPHMQTEPNQTHITKTLV